MHQVVSPSVPFFSINQVFKQAFKVKVSFTVIVQALDSFVYSQQAQKTSVFHLKNDISIDKRLFPHSTLGRHQFWSLEVQPQLRQRQRHELLGVVLSNDLCPMQTVPVSESATAAIEIWKKKDVVARDIIISTLEPSLTNILVTCTTAASM